MDLPNYIRKKRGKLELKKGKKWITWNPYHSKLAAYLLGSGENFGLLLGKVKFFIWVQLKEIQ